MRTASNILRIGVDTGGTFTDFVVWRGGRLANLKVLSTPRNPAAAVLGGLGEIAGPTAGAFIVHGTTVATNALLEARGGRIALVTTAGFEDVLAVGRQTRRELYRLQGEIRRELVPRSRRFGLGERLSASGRVERAPGPGEIERLVARVRRSGARAVALCLLHSYANPVHEKLVADALRGAGWLVSVSSELLPEYREYERASTTAVNAYLMPVMDRYLDVLEKGIGRSELRIMQSNGGWLAPARARREPIRTALSGPAGGAVGALASARASGFPNIIGFDMGGTSTDVTLLEGEIRRTSEGRVGEFPVRLPMIDIHSVGAGGGSIAAVDRGGSLRVGPRSAGADPGPACYGRGDLPTVTDANLVLGRLDPEFFLGGRMRISPGRSRDAVARLAGRIGKSAVDTARGIVAIANANMEKAIRVISVERGHDPRRLSLLPFGGAGGMHAAELAARLGMPRIIIPRNAGVLSAFGLLCADAVKDRVRSLLKPESRLAPGELETAFRGLERLVVRDMRDDGFAPDRVVLRRLMDLRYAGQSYEITMPLPGRSATPGALRRAFDREHRRLYSYDHPARPVEVVNVRVQAVSAGPRIPFRRHSPGPSDAGPALVRTREMICGGRRMTGAVYDRDRLEAGAAMRGPALIVDSESTTYLPPGYLARVDPVLNIIVVPERGRRADA